MKLRPLFLRLLPVTRPPGVRTSAAGAGATPMKEAHRPLRLLSVGGDILIAYSLQPTITLIAYSVSADSG